MKILLMEGNEIVREAILENYNSPTVAITAVSNLCDGIYNLFYSAKEFDKVIIGDELETSVDTASLEEELGTLLQRLEDCRYFPVEFGKICIELCKKKGKKEPKIVVLTTCISYEFWTPKAEVLSSMEIAKEIQRFVESNGMLLVDKTDEDFSKRLRSVLK